MKQLIDYMRAILATGSVQKNRTGVDAITKPGAMMVFDVRNDYPAVTCKELAFKSVKGELLGFLRGCDNAAQFRALGCKIWDANANGEGRPGHPNLWLKSRHRKGLDDLGRIYGVQWNDWRDVQICQREEEAEFFVSEGYTLVAVDLERQVWVVKRSINQLENALRTLLTDPYDRRILISAWRPDEFDQMALPPCHVTYQFLADVNKNELHLCMMQRSADSFLGVPFNTASAALFLAIMARLSGFKAASFTHFIADAHIYVDSLDQVKEQMSRTPFALPQLVIDDEIKKVALDKVPGAFKRIEPSHIWLDGYKSHPSIKAQMAV